MVIAQCCIYDFSKKETALHEQSPSTLFLFRVNKCDDEVFCPLCSHGSGGLERFGGLIQKSFLVCP